MISSRTITKVGLLLVTIGIAGSLVTWFMAHPLIFESEERTVDAAPVKTIEITASNADVNIIPATEPQVHVKLTGWRTNQRLDVEANGDTLVIRVVSPHPINLFGGSPDLSVALPGKAYDSLQVRLSNGQVSAGQINAGTISITTKNGRIQLDDARADQIDLETNNGNITVNRAEGGITAQTDNGRISVATRDLDRPIYLESGNGNITVTTNKAPTSATLDLRTNNGRITVLGTRTGSSWHQSFGAGDHLVKVTTNNGNIAITE